MARLHDEDVGSADVFENLEINFAIAEPPEKRLAQRHIQVLADALCEHRVCHPRENLESVVIHSAGSPARLSLCSFPCLPAETRRLNHRKRKSDPGMP